MSSPRADSAPAAAFTGYVCASGARRRTSSHTARCDRCRGSHRGEHSECPRLRNPTPERTEQPVRAGDAHYRSSRRPRVAVAARGRFEKIDGLREAQRGPLKCTACVPAAGTNREDALPCRQLPLAPARQVPREQRAPRTRCMSARLPHLLSAVQRLSKFAGGEPRPALTVPSGTCIARPISLCDKPDQYASSMVCRCSIGSSRNASRMRWRLSSAITSLHVSERLGSSVESSSDSS